MERYEIDVVENAANAVNIMPESPLEKVVADCMNDYMEYRKAEEQGLLLMLTCRPGDEIHFIFDKKIYSGTAVKVISVRSKTHDFTRVEIEFEIEDPWYNDGRKMKHGANEILGEKAFLTKAEAEKALAEMR